MNASRDRLVRLHDGGDGIRVRRWGSRGVPVLLLHGFMGGVEEWGDLPAGLRGCRVVAVDLPGHGRSPGPTDPERYGVARVARDLATLQEQIFPEPAVWVGYSMGGRIALAAAVQSVPMRALFLEGASPGLRDARDRRERRARDEERARRIEVDGLERFVDQWLQLPLFAGLARAPAAVRLAARDVRSNQDPRRMAAWLRGGGTGSQPSYWGDLGELDLPVHLLVGERDVKFRGIAREMAALLPDPRVTVAPGVGHVAHLEAPSLWLEWLQAAVTPGR